MSSIQSQFPDLTARHDVYEAIDPATTLAGSAAGKVVFIAGASRGIGQAKAVAFARAGAKAIYLTARSEAALQETLAKVRAANPATDCAIRVCDVTSTEEVGTTFHLMLPLNGKLNGVATQAATAAPPPQTMPTG